MFEQWIGIVRKITEERKTFTLIFCTFIKSSRCRIRTDQVDICFYRVLFFPSLIHTHGICLSCKTFPKRNFHFWPGTFLGDAAKSVVFYSLFIFLITFFFCVKWKSVSLVWCFVDKNTGTHYGVRQNAYENEIGAKRITDSFLFFVVFFVHEKHPFKPKCAAHPVYFLFRRWENIVHWNHWYTESSKQFCVHKR